MNESVQAALADVARMMARYGSAILGLYYFSTREISEEFRAALELKYPYEGYGTSSTPPQLTNDKYLVTWHVGSSD